MLDVTDRYVTYILKKNPKMTICVFFAMRTIQVMCRVVFYFFIYFFFSVDRDGNASVSFPEHAMYIFSIVLFFGYTVKTTQLTSFFVHMRIVFFISCTLFFCSMRALNWFLDSVFAGGAS